MTGIFVNGVPLAEVLEDSEVTETAEEKRQKFVQIQRNPELHITACAVSKMAQIDCLPELEEYENYFVEPNRKWLENQSDPFAWVKVYYKINPNTDFGIIGRVQTIIIPMTFLGESPEECWGEVQLCIKKQIIRDGYIINLKNVELGRHACFDTRVGKWVEETKPIVPKKDAGTHGYIALRLYHQDYLPENQPDWYFEPLYVAIADEDYRIEAKWEDEQITITANMLDDHSSEIPKFLRQG